ncbi:sugar phosphate nucleotidyltransferase (plasmid) [Novosphingobium sp. BL-8A]|uniref:mannose-1-phosphate guanylyltransferase n=1 Tax=Novosphingobium sp. BL-8A TaxID=3127639 RepID=UPI0037577D16
MIETHTILPVILCGGSGTRLWPLSRPERPKQFHRLLSSRTMLQTTAHYVSDRERFAAPLIIGGSEFGGEIRRQMKDADIEGVRVILEPLARNTAPAIALAALASARPDDLLLVLPSDHAIQVPDAFQRALDLAAPLAREGWLCTFGIEPGSPNTGYGYIRTGEPLAPGIQRIACFVEKPDADRAQAMLDAGGHLWNAGIFLLRADALLAALGLLQPAVAIAAAEAMALARVQFDGTILPDAKAFAAAPAISIDHGVLERHDKVAVVPVAMGWSDIGSWDALYEARERDDDDNCVRGPSVRHDSRGCLVHSEGPRVALLGVDDLIVVATGADILIMARGRSQEVRELSAEMQRA